MDNIAHLSIVLYKVPSLLFSNAVRLLAELRRRRRTSRPVPSDWSVYSKSTFNCVSLVQRLVKLQFQPSRHVYLHQVLAGRSVISKTVLLSYLTHPLYICNLFPNQQRNAKSHDLRVWFLKPGRSMFHGFCLICLIVGRSPSPFSTKKEAPFTWESPAEQPRLI